MINAEGAAALMNKPQDNPGNHTIEKRRHQRYVVDSSATVHLINTGLRLRGRIENLSPAGCRIRTEQPFTVGIYIRAEVDFHLDGQHFRLPAVTQAVHDKHTVGIRFLEMSTRKHDQLMALIEELKANSGPVIEQAADQLR